MRLDSIRRSTHLKTYSAPTCGFSSHQNCPQTFHTIYYLPSVYPALLLALDVGLGLEMGTHISMQVLS